MSKADEIKKYISDREGNDKEKIIKGLMKEFKLSESSARTYYSRWKVGYMNTKNCIPKEKKTFSDTKKVIKKREKMVIDFETKDVDTKEEQVIEEVETTKEDKYINKDLRVLKKVATVKGIYDVYEKDGSKVKSSKLEFNNPDDVEKYEKKLIAEEEEIFLKKKAEIRLRLNEILDVMLMEV